MYSDKEPEKVNKMANMRDGFMCKSCTYQRQPLNVLAVRFEVSNQRAAANRVAPAHVEIAHVRELCERWQRGLGGVKHIVHAARIRMSCRSRDRKAQYVSMLLQKCERDIFSEAGNKTIKPI